MKTRNPEATCATCPYAYETYCQRFAPAVRITHCSSAWCGEHPDFFLEEGPLFVQNPSCRVCGGVGIVTAETGVAGITSLPCPECYPND